MNNPHLTTLEVLDHISRSGPTSAKDLCTRFDISVPTLNRYIKDLRHYGADIISARVKGEHVYGVANQDAIKGRLGKWLDIERNRTLLE